MIKQILFAAVALSALAACQPRVPDSGSDVGFDRVDAARDAELRGEAGVQATLDGPVPVGESALDSAAAANARAANSGVDPVQADPSNPAPLAVTNSVGISQEQDFDAVSGQRGINDDAARIAAARAQYRVIEPSALPRRPGTDIPNIVEYAIQTNNPIGVQVYRRGGVNAANRSARNCASYASPDLAQEEFLRMGGPERDRRSLDPDGDGFACTWDPTPFRRAVQNARTN